MPMSLFSEFKLGINLIPLLKITPYFCPISPESMAPAGTAAITVSLVNEDGDKVGDHHSAFRSLIAAHRELEEYPHDVFRDPSGLFQVTFSPSGGTQDLKNGLALSFEYYVSVPPGKSREDVLEEGLKLYFDLLQSYGVEWDLGPGVIHFKTRSTLNQPDWLTDHPEDIISAALAITPDEDNPDYRHFVEVAERARAARMQNLDVRDRALSTYRDLRDQDLDRSQIVAVASQLVVIAQAKTGEAEGEMSGDVRDFALSTYEGWCNMGFDEKQIVALANELVAISDSGTGRRGGKS